MSDVRNASALWCLWATRTCLPIAALLAVSTLPGVLFAEESVSYSRDIQPILSSKCFKCHGRDGSSRKAKLRLDKSEFALAGDPAPIVPGKPDESEIIYRIKTDDEADLMPPPDHRKPLATEEIALLERWVAQGADYEGHWAFSPPSKPEPPAVDESDWQGHPIDRFVLTESRKHGLGPNPPADRRTLIRRVSFDLTGLPPSAEAVGAFVNDPAKTDEAYAALVEDLLKSPHYGEHRARYWLDAARYGDTHGLHLDNYREMWPYRDWVINAFNANMPFDQFTLEQLAGDLLERPTLDQRIATGFSRCNVTTSEGGAIDDEYNAIYAKDRVATMTKVWMGLSADCASCHDHKFDPITQKEFYQLTAFFRNTTQKAMDGNAKDTPPNVFVPAHADRERWFAVDGDIDIAKQLLETRKRQSKPAFEKWLESSNMQGTPVVEGTALHLLVDEGGGKRVKSTIGEGFPIVDRATWIDGLFGKALQFTDGSYVELGDHGDFERDQKFSYGAWIKSPGKSTGAVIARMDRDHGHRGWDLWMQDDRVAAHLIYSWPEDYLKVSTKAKLKKDEWTHVFATYDGSSKPTGAKIYFNGVEQELDREGKVLDDTIRTTTSLKLGRRNTGQGFRDGGLHDFRLYNRELSADEVSRLAKDEVIRDLRAIALDTRTKEQNDVLLQFYLDQIDKDYHKFREQITTLQKEKEAMRKRGATTLVMHEKPDKPFAHMLRRGEYDQPGEKVYPNTIEALLPMPKGEPRNRLGLARWLIDPKHPLTARVTVNRLWQQLFGRGLVETAEDFGTMGQQPSHPELLDWLAVEFRESGWDVKHMLRLMITSSAYRQSSDSTSKKNAQDPDNRFLSRGPRFRLDAEMIRDQALVAGDLLVNQLGGPSVKPYQPPGIWFAVGYTRSNTARFEQDRGNNLYRRSLYTFWKRTAAPPSMEVFNAPSRESCTLRRERTNTPLQALTLMNDPQFIEAARHLATNAIEACGENTHGRTNHIAMRVLARPFDTDEHALMEPSLNAFRKTYLAEPAEAKKLISIGESKPSTSIPAPELAAWTMVASQILNFDEAITKH